MKKYKKEILFGLWGLGIGLLLFVIVPGSDKGKMLDEEYDRLKEERDSLRVERDALRAKTEEYKKIVSEEIATLKKMKIEADESGIRINGTSSFGELLDEVSRLDSIANN